MYSRSRSANTKNTSNGGPSAKGRTCIEPFNIRDMQPDNKPLHPPRDKHENPHDALIATTFGKEKRDMDPIDCSAKNNPTIDAKETVLSRVAFQGGIGQQQFKYPNHCGTTGIDTAVNDANYHSVAGHTKLATNQFANNTSVGTAATMLSSTGAGGSSRPSRGGGAAATAPLAHSSAVGQLSVVGTISSNGGGSGGNNNTLHGHTYKVNRYASYNSTRQASSWGSRANTVPEGTTATDFYLDTHPNAATIPSDLVNYEKMLDPARYQRHQQQFSHHRKVMEAQALAASYGRNKRYVSGGGGNGGTGANGGADDGNAGTLDGGVSVAASSAFGDAETRSAFGKSDGGHSNTNTITSSAQFGTYTRPTQPGGGGPFDPTAAYTQPKKFGTVRDTAAMLEAQHCRSTRTKHYENLLANPNLQLLEGGGGGTTNNNNGRRSSSAGGGGILMNGGSSSLNNSMSLSDSRSALNNSFNRNGRGNGGFGGGAGGNKAMTATMTTVASANANVGKLTLSGINNRNEQATTVGRVLSSALGGNGPVRSSTFAGRGDASGNANFGTGGSAVSPGPAAYTVPSVFDDAKKVKLATILRNGERRPATMTKGGLVGVETQHPTILAAREAKEKVVSDREAVVRAAAAAMTPTANALSLGIGTPSAGALNPLRSGEGHVQFSASLDGDDLSASPISHKPPRPPQLALHNLPNYQGGGGGGGADDGGGTYADAGIRSVPSTARGAGGVGGDRPSSSANKPATARSYNVSNGFGIPLPALPNGSGNGPLTHNVQLKLQHQRRDRVLNATPDRQFV